MLDQGVSLRVVFMWLAWVCTALLVATDWAFWDAPHLGDLSIILITIAATLSILNDNARTRQCARACLTEVADGRDDGRPLTPVR